MPPISYAPPQFPPAGIQHAVWVYLRFILGYRDVEDLLAERGRDVSYETVRRWGLKFGPAFARRLRHRRPKPGAGISMRWWRGSPARRCTSGARWITKARFSTSSCSADATRRRP